MIVLLDPYKIGEVSSSIISVFFNGLFSIVRSFSFSDIIWPLIICLFIFIVIKLLEFIGFIKIEKNNKKVDEED